MFHKLTRSMALMMAGRIVVFFVVFFILAATPPFSLHRPTAVDQMESKSLLFFSSRGAEPWWIFTVWRRP